MDGVIDYVPRYVSSSSALERLHELSPMCRSRFSCDRRDVDVSLAPLGKYPERIFGGSPVVNILVVF